MSTESVRGLVISEYSKGEADKYITILTENEGKVTLLARGAKKLKSKFMAAAGVFNYGEFFYFKGNGFNSLNDADVDESFDNIKKDYAKLAYASFIIEAADKTAYGDTEELLRLTLYALTALDKTDISPEVVNCAFKIKLLDIMGFLNSEGVCINCGNEETPFFSADEGGFVCKDCFRKFTDSIPASAGCKKAVEYIAGNDFKRIFSFRASESVMKERDEISASAIRLNISREFKTDKIIKTL